tara:strand:+ start:275 stop:403 length:129 start_codon:yes stop_codon:yes gene_type:complete
MPLQYNKSKKSLGYNIKKEVKSGKPIKQAIAIAKKIQKKGAK